MSGTPLTALLSFEEALVRVLALADAGVPCPAEEVPLAAAAGRIVAAPVTAVRDLPPFDQSAMDGYALDRDVPEGAWVECVGRTAAGDAPGELVPGHPHRIFTGAPVPAGADAVIPQERVVREESRVRTAILPQPGANIRRQGEDIRAGEELIAAGTRLDWRPLTLLAGQGLARIAVRPRVRVALLGSGRELRQPGESAGAGQIYDSNRPMLAALLTLWGAETVAFPPVADDPEVMRAALAQAAATADLVVSNAGISVGEEDHVRAAVDRLGGALSVLKVAMKPGRPLIAGRLGDTVFLGLPGNPMAALAGAVAFLRPLLARMAGEAPPAGLALRAGFSRRKQPGRTEFVPVRILRREAEWWGVPVGNGGSGQLACLPATAALAVLPAGAGEIAEGTLLPALPFGPTELLAP